MKDPHLYDGRFVEERKYDIAQVWESHHEILRLLVLGWNNVRIAEELHITAQTVSNVRNSPMAREHLAKLTGERDQETVEIHRRVQEFAPVALEVLENIIKGNTDASIGLIARTAENALGRAGHGPVHKVLSASHTFTSGEIEAIKERAREAAREQGVIEGEYENVGEKQ